MTTVYDAGYSYNVTVGVGVFNGSLIQPFITFLQSLSEDYEYQVAPYTYLSAVNSLISNPLISTISSPVSCAADDCQSYLITGGVEMATPWIPDIHHDFSLVIIENPPSIQLNTTHSENYIFQEDECDLYGGVGYTIGIKLCIAKEELSPGLLRAGKLHL
jgi:hypothetical protein